jgi:lipoate-protein ligase A
MSTSAKKRLLIEDSGTGGSWNMAVDEYLLLRAVLANELSVRIYSWETATVSLGYFQDSMKFLASGQFSSLPVVRRLSGGGAILHDREITYSISVPATHSLSADPVQLYEAVHSGIARVLKSAGIDLKGRGEALPQEHEPFLCFSRGDRNDLLLQGVKMVGSAQRRRKGAVLQHGSILLEASPHAAELPGIRNLTPSFHPDAALRHRIGEAIYEETTGHNCKVERDPDAPSVTTQTVLSEDEQVEIRTIEESHYANIDQLRTRSAGQDPL